MVIDITTSVINGNIVLKESSVNWENGNFGIGRMVSDRWDGGVFLFEGG